MVYVLVKHRVEDPGKWKKVFDENAGMRRAAGEVSHQVFKSAYDANEVFVLVEWKDREMAAQFMQSSSVKEAMKKAGVIGKPVIEFLERVE